MKQKKKKPMYLKVRLPMIVKTGGAHTPGKGGKYRRQAEKAKARREVSSEL